MKIIIVFLSFLIVLRKLIKNINKINYFRIGYIISKRT